MANLLTALRLVLILPVAGAIANPALMPGWLLLLLLLVAIATDYFDGIVARTRGSVSSAGQLFDHGTDFLFVTSGLAAAAFAGLINPWLPGLIVVAFSQYVLDSHYLYREKQLHMNFLGRWNGILYFAPLLLIALGRLWGATLPGWLAAGTALLAWLLLISTLGSIIDRALAPWRASRQHSPVER